MKRLRIPNGKAAAICLGLAVLLGFGSRSAAAPTASAASAAPIRLAFESGLFLRPDLTLTGIYTVKATGGGRRQLVRDPRGLGDFAWSPDARRLAFARSSGGLFVVQADGSAQRRLTGDPHVGRLAWSPNGSSIAFTSKRYGAWKIYVVKSAGGTARLLASQPKIHDFLAWSPSGRQILLQRGRFHCGDIACALDIYVMHADGTAAHLLARRADGDAAWSPDGRRIAFSERKAEFDNDIYVMNADGSNKRDLTRGDIDSSDFSPDWSPDGTRIAFSRYLVSEETDEIYVMKPDGSQLRRLTRHRSQFPPSDDDPVWSPNGSRIAFDRLTYSGHDSQVFVMNADGSGARNVAPGTAWDTHPLWQPPRR